MRLRLTALAVLALIFALSVWRVSAHPAANFSAKNVIASDSRQPVLVELFTSEGCVDCPRADSLLATLDESQPIVGAEVIALSEHVDYWNSDGWKDPYSSHDFTERQQDYAESFHLDSPYSPQMVVDGSAQFVGSDKGAAFENIGNAAAIAKTPIEISAIRVMGEKHVAMHIDIRPPVNLVSSFSGDVWVALADDSDESHVKAGENAGRMLSHVAVVRRFTRVGDVYHSPYSVGVSLYTGDANLTGLRIVAFVQHGSGGKIIGLGTAQLPR